MYMPCTEQYSCLTALHTIQEQGDSRMQPYISCRMRYKLMAVVGGASLLAVLQLTWPMLNCLRQSLCSAAVPEPIATAALRAISTATAVSNVELLNQGPPQPELAHMSAGTAARTTKLNLCNAVNNALALTLESNPRSVVLGEDVVFGGVFRCTLGLAEKFGRHRVFNTPLSEQGIAGFSIGLATMGYAPVAEIQFADYIYPAFDQLVNEAAKYRYRSGSSFECGGLTIRAPCGAVGHGGHYHSQSPESFFTHVPGLKVVIPSTPAEAKGLLLSAIQEPDPVVFFEPKILYRTAVEDVPVGMYTIPLGKARRVLDGDDITLVGWGAQVLVLEQAAQEVSERHGITCDVLDLRTLLPWDVEAVEESVNRTGRLIVSHEAPLTSGFGAEVVSRITDRCFARLEAPPLRITGHDTPFPLMFEPLYLPSVQRVVQGIMQTVNY